MTDTRTDRSQAMNTTREAALEAALKLARNRLQACAIDHPTGSREMAERSEWADEATAALSTPATEPQGLAHIVDYTNWRGETARRVIRPIRMWWGKTEWHPEEQWMLTAWDCEKDAIRDFAWQDMRPVQNPATSAAARPDPQPATEPQGYVEGLLPWYQTADDQDTSAKTDFGDYQISVDSAFAGQSHYLWVAGQAEDDEPHATFPNMHQAKAAAQAHFNAIASRPAPQPAAEHEYPDPLIAEDRYEDDQPAADTRVVVKEQLAQWFYALVHMDTRGKLDAEISASLQSQMLEIIGTATPAPTYQSRVKPWLDACFGPEIAGDKTDRNHRFLEEALELVQSGGCTASEAHQLVDYVYGRPVGEMGQEIGGVMNTLAALCLAYGRDMHEDGETELARVWTKVEKIRAKQAAKPKHSPLPEHTPAPSDKIAEAAQDKTAAELVIDAYDAANPFRQADMHPALCHCNRCAIDWMRALAGKGE